MTIATASAGPHDHVFLGPDHARNERRTWLVIALTAAMMVAEIVAGSIFGSMALLADGWHMSTHASALLIAALAYRYARRHAHDPRFTFGTGKLGDLAAFGSATVLALVAVLIGWESLMRLRSPVSINFDEAVLVAALGLAVNLLSAWLLREDHGHGHGHGVGHGHGHAHDHGSAGAHGHDLEHEHDHDHDHPHPHDHHHGHDHPHPHPARPPSASQHAQPRQSRSHGHRDNNLRAAYMHVMADALTSVLAIVALLAGRQYGWVWLDPVIGLVGAAIILRWSWVLLRDSGAVLLDYATPQANTQAQVRRVLETEDDQIIDLHVWHLGPGHQGAIISILSRNPKPVSAYRQMLEAVPALSHVTIEVQARA